VGLWLTSDGLWLCCYAMNGGDGGELDRSSRGKRPAYGCHAATAVADGSALPLRATAVDVAVPAFGVVTFPNWGGGGGSSTAPYGAGVASFSPRRRKRRGGRAPPIGGRSGRHPAGRAHRAVAAAAGYRVAVDERRTFLGEAAAAAAASAAAGARVGLGRGRGVDHQCAGDPRGGPWASWGGDACGGLCAAALVGYSTVDGAGVAEGGEEPPRWWWLRRPWRAPPAAGEGEMDGDGSTGGHADGAGGLADGAGSFADGAGGLGDVAAAVAAVASAVQPLPPSLSLNVATMGLRVSWRARRQRPVEPRHHLFGPRRS